MLPELREETALAHQAGANLPTKRQPDWRRMWMPWWKPGWISSRASTPPRRAAMTSPTLPGARRAAPRSKGLLPVAPGGRHPGGDLASRRTRHRHLRSERRIHPRRSGWRLHLPRVPGYPPPADYYATSRPDARAIIEAWRELRCVYSLSRIRWSVGCGIFLAGVVGTCAGYPDICLHKSNNARREKSSRTCRRSSSTGC